MVNSYIDAQCKNMVLTVDTFVQACQLAAVKDDGQVSKEEQKALKRIMTAAEKFKAEIRKL